MPIQEFEQSDEQAEINGEVADFGAHLGGKTKKRSNGVEVQANGDAINVDINGVSAPSRGQSEAVVSDVESPIAEELPPISTLSIGLSSEIQTEKVAHLESGATIVKIGDTTDPLEKTSWHPSHAAIMCTAGSSVLRLIHVADSSQDDSPAPIVNQRDVTIPVDNFLVTAFCWNLETEASLAVFEDKKNELGHNMMTARLISISDAASKSRIVFSQSEAFFALRWNERSERLMSISGNDERGTVRIWNFNESDPLYTIGTNKPVQDGTWTSDSSFFVCGEGFLAYYDLSTGTEGTFRTIHLDALKSSSPTVETKWNFARYDPVSGVVACGSEITGDLCYFSARTIQERLDANATEETISRIQHNLGGITAMEFQPNVLSEAGAASSSRLLAVSSDTGLIELWDVAGSPSRKYRFQMHDRAVGAISFSPDGRRLAAAGVDVVRIWDCQSGGLPKAMWKADKNIEWDTSIDEAEEFELNHILGWNADGTKLAFTLKNQVCFANFLAVHGYENESDRCRSQSSTFPHSTRRLRSLAAPDLELLMKISR